MRHTKDAVAIAAAVSLLLVACGDDPDDQSGRTTAPDDVAVEEAAVSPDDVDDDGSGRLPTTLVPPSSGAAGEVDGQSPTGSAPVSGTRAQVDPVALEGPAAIFDDESDQHWLLPWREGFLSLRIEFGPQASPELPEELAALIPQEVWDLFPDGLPPTLAEAQQIVSEAGLLGVVIDAMNESEELSDAIYSGETPPPVVSADFTTDGVAWESLPIELPTDAASIQQVVSTGEEIALFGGQMEGDTPPECYVATSTGNLEDWSVDVLAASPVDDLGGIFDVGGFGSFAANDDRWIVRSTTEVWVNAPAVLRLAGIEDPDRHGYILRATPDALIVHPPVFIAWEDVGLTREEGEQLAVDEVLELAGIDLGTTQELSGWMTSPEGMIIEADPSDIGRAADAVTVAWEDTDLNAEQVAALREALDAPPPDPYMMGSRAVAEYWSAEWGEEPTHTGSDEDAPGSYIYAVESGFLQHAHRLVFSADGVHWARVEGAPADHWVVGTMPVDDGTVVLMNYTGNRTWSMEMAEHAFLVSSDMQQWQEVQVDGLPHDVFIPEGVIDSAAEVVIGDSGATSGVWLMATADGVTWIVDPLGSDSGLEERYDFRAARNGSTVLVFGPEGWARYQLDG